MIELPCPAAYPTSRLTPLRFVDSELPVAPVSPTTGSKAWDILSGTIKHTLNRSKGELIVSPGIMTGNTDTRRVAELPHLLRASRLKTLIAGITGISPETSSDSLL